MHRESRANDNYIRLACTTNEKKNEKRIIKYYLLNEEESIEIRLRIHRKLLRIKYIEERKWK